jgi:flagellin-like hook-associated protein FlgL
MQDWFAVALTALAMVATVATALAVSRVTANHAQRTADKAHTRIDGVLENVSFVRADLGEIHGRVDGVRKAVDTLTAEVRGNRDTTDAKLDRLLERMRP